MQSTVFSDVVCPLNVQERLEVSEDRQRLVSPHLILCTIHEISGLIYGKETVLYPVW